MRKSDSAECLCSMGLAPRVGRSDTHMQVDFRAAFDLNPLQLCERKDDGVLNLRSLMSDCTNNCKVLIVGCVPHFP
jgi:hypothetical protein